MSECKWTDDQIAAINARGVQTLVSAAAGSGKTAVLTERVKNLICNADNRCEVSQLLVVTYTKAAAAEMRARIGKALLKEIAAPGADVPYLKRQLLLLPNADICTIDSFCLKIVKDNFSSAGVSPNLRIMDDSEHKALLAETADAVLERAYENTDEGFIALNSLFIGENSDTNLSNIIIMLYDKSRSYPMPEQWLDEICADFETGKTPDGTAKWSDIIKDYISMMFEYYNAAFTDMIERMTDDGGFKPNFIDWFRSLLPKIESIINPEKRTWDELIGIIYSLNLNAPKLYYAGSDEGLKSEVKTLKEKFTDDVKKLIGLSISGNLTLPTTEQHLEDTAMLYPAVKKLCELVKAFSAELDKIKSERDEYSFNDILHKCINLLCVVTPEGKLEKTALALSLSDLYKEILIDEYQDTNDAQNIIFELVSRNKTNFYCVGDVKQSIYRFRLASPELFIKLSAMASSQNGPGSLSKIILKQNFRSREGITQFVNYLFSRLMTQRVGDIDYTEDEYLNYSEGQYSSENRSEADITVSFADIPGMKADDAAALEAESIADYIQSVKNSGITVGNKDAVRAVDFGDFCILVRASTRADIYASALKARNIPCTYISENKVSDSKEVYFLTSLLKVISNPLLDVPLAAVMMSPIFGFTADELANMRINHSEGDLYQSLVKYAETDDKSKDFLAKLAVYRNISAAYTVYDFVKLIIEDTGVSDIYLSYEHPAARTAAIKAILDAAYKFTDDGKTGLNSFIRYIDKCIEIQSLTASEIDPNAENSVKIMTIHKSKGLEFPFVILPQCVKKFNYQDSKSKIMISRKTGIGIKIRNDKTLSSYHSLSSIAALLDIKLGEISEEMRVLYVALTRAKEKLVIFCTNTDKKLADNIKQMYRTMLFSPDGKINPYCVYDANSMAEWMLACLAAHSDCDELCRYLGLMPQQGESAFKIEFLRHDPSFDDDLQDDAEPEPASGPAPIDETVIDEGILAEITARTDFVYKYDALKGVLAKRTASSFESGKSKYRFTYSKPFFAKAKLTGAQKGTAIHKYLEICDFFEAAADSAAEAARLLQAGLLTEEEYNAIDHAAVKAFFDSSFGQTILSAGRDNIFKEYKFSVLIKSGELYPDLTDDLKSEELVVEGKIDCAFIKDGSAYIIDYKTDNITDESILISIYAEQLKMYCRAFEACKGIAVKKCCIYSFKLQKFIEL